MDGVRVDAFTPYISYAKQKPGDRNLQGIGFEQSTASVGVRWDLKITSLKLRYDRVKAPDSASTQGSASYFVRATPAFITMAHNEADQPRRRIRFLAMPCKNFFK